MAGDRVAVVTRTRRRARAVLSRARRRVVAALDRHAALVVVGPPAAVLAAQVVYPLVWVVYRSVLVEIPGRPTYVDPLYHYAYVLESSAFHASLVRTLVFATGSFALAFTGGLALALALHRARPRWLRRTYLTAVCLVLAVPVSVAALTWRALLAGHEGGLLNAVLLAVGLRGGPVAVLEDPALALPAVMVVDAWVRLPLATLVFLAGRRAVPGRYYDAARVHGATPLQTFRHVTLPHLRPYMATVALLVWTTAVQAFSTVWLMTDGGPVNATRTASLLVYQVGISYLRFGQGSALSVVLVVCCLALSAGVVRRTVR